MDKLAEVSYTESDKGRCAEVPRIEMASALVEKWIAENLARNERAFVTVSPVKVAGEWMYEVIETRGGE